MHFSIVFIIIIYIVVVVHADLTCLGWGLISPIVGLFCHFEPTYFHAAESHGTAVVKDAVESVENLVKFDLTHNPAVVTYNFIEQTEKGGIGQGSQYLKNITNDYENVMIGFGKEASNQMISILESTYWNDLSMCFITGASSLAIHAHAQKQIGKRVGLHRTTSQTKASIMNQGTIVPPSDALAIAHGCFTDKFQRIANPIKFQVNGTNQKVGSTISDLAAFLIPVGEEEKAAAGASDILKGAVDLAIPGSESTARIVKMVGKNTGDHFASEAEAQAVAKKMKEKSWVKDNCGICGNSPVPLNNLISKKLRRRDNYSLNRRGNTMASCCRLPLVTESEETPIAEGYDPLESNPFYMASKPREFKLIKEAELVSPPILIMRNKQIANDIKLLSHDLNTLSTGLIKWSPEVTNAMGSDELLSTLRKVFTQRYENRKGFEYSYIGTVDDGERLRIKYWENFKSDPELKPIYDWIKAAEGDAIDTIAQLKGLNPEDKSHLGSETEIFYTKPGEKALEGFDVRGWHIDGGIMQFGIADVPGLIVGNSISKKGSRLPVAKDAWHLLKAFSWDQEATLQRLPEGPTWHTVFGPEMAKEGRVSVLITIGQIGKFF